MSIPISIKEVFNKGVSYSVLPFEDASCKTRYVPLKFAGFYIGRLQEQEHLEQYV